MVREKDRGVHSLPAWLPETVEISLRDVLAATKDGLLALSAAVGLRVMRRTMETEVTALVGPKGKHVPLRRAYRHGQEQGWVVLGGRKVAIQRPRVRTVDGEEVPLRTYRAFQREDLLHIAAMERMLYGLATRRYPHGLEPVGEEVDAHSYETSKGTISRRFREQTCKALEELLARRLDDRRFVVLILDGLELGGHTVVAALGIDLEGKKHVLGLWEGATENAAVCRALLEDLVERGLRVEEGLLVILDRGKALRAAVRDVLGCKALAQRCQGHKQRNVLEHLPQVEQPRVHRLIEAAYREASYEKALARLQDLARQLEVQYPGAAASLREGLEETLTVVRLQLLGTLRQTLRSTNPLESAFDKVRAVHRQVKRWRHGEQVLRWAAAGLRVAEQGFRRFNGYRDLPRLAELLKQEVNPVMNGEVKFA